MTVSAPHVYIADVLMESHKLADVPVLAGLSFDWGTDSMVDFDEAKTLSAQLLVRTPSTLDFLTVGAPFGLVDPDTGDTFFAGRLATLKATPDSRFEDALLISLTATDTTADLAQYRVERIDWSPPISNDAQSTTGAMRHNQIAAVMPAGFALTGSTPHDAWTSARPQRWTAAPLLPILDMHCRSVIGRRHNTSRYIPGSGLAPRITITPERSKAAAADRLVTHSNGEWYMTTPNPSVWSATLKLDAGHVAKDIEWEKTPDDVITDVALTSNGLGLAWNQEQQAVTWNDESDTFEIWVDAYLGVDNRAIQQKFGFHQLTLDVDTLGGDQNVNPHIGQIVNYWIDADTQWRPTTVRIPDSRRLPDALVRQMLNTTNRANAYTTIDGLPASNPAGGSRVRAYAIGGSATWTGKKWEVELTLGRVPRPSANAGNTTFTGLRNSTNAAISAGTARTVGNQLSFADFAYIGA